MALVIEIKVVPSSGKSVCVVDIKGQIKCFLKSPPEQGKANDELIKLLAKMVGVSVADVRIVVGTTYRKKTVRIDTSLTYEQFIAHISSEKQQRLFI